MEILERALADYEGAILAISHDRYFIDALANRIAGFLGQIHPLTASMTT